jgi:hypothetical protein
MNLQDFAAFPFKRNFRVARRSFERCAMRAVKLVCVADTYADSAPVPAPVSALVSALVSERMKIRKFAILRAWKEDFSDLEYSDYGRAPRFLSGWWILPGLALGMLLTLAACSV